VNNRVQELSFKPELLFFKSYLLDQVPDPPPGRPSGAAELILWQLKNESLQFILELVYDATGLDAPPLWRPPRECLDCLFGRFGSIHNHSFWNARLQFQIRCRGAFGDGGTYPGCSNM
jgi:hypothetical protein